MLAIRSWSKELDKKPSHINAKKVFQIALKLGIETYQILTDDDEVSIPSLSSILLAAGAATDMTSPQKFWAILVKSIHFYNSDCTIFTRHKIVVF